MLLKVRMKREEEGDSSLDLRFSDLQNVQDLLQALGGAETKDLLVEIRFGSREQTDNGKVTERDNLETLQKSAKYTYG